MALDVAIAPLLLAGRFGMALGFTLLFFLISRSGFATLRVWLKRLRSPVLTIAVSASCAIAAFVTLLAGSGNPQGVIVAISAIVFGVSTCFILVSFTIAMFAMSKSEALGVYVLGSYFYGGMRLLAAMLQTQLVASLYVMSIAIGAFVLIRDYLLWGVPTGDRGDGGSSTEAGERRGRKLYLASLLGGLFGYTFLFAELTRVWVSMSTVGLSDFVIQMSVGLGIVAGTFLFDSFRKILSKEGLSSYLMLLSLIFIAILYFGANLIAETVPIYIIWLYCAQRIAFSLVWFIPFSYSIASEHLLLFSMGLCCTEGGMLAYKGLERWCSGGNIYLTLVVSVVIVALITKELFAWHWLSGRSQSEKDDTRVCLISDDDLNDFATRYGLTKRERELLPFILQNSSAKYIADSLYISINTVKTHHKNIYAKVGVKSRGDLKRVFDGDEAGK